jgi:hypothetical protein
MNDRPGCAGVGSGLVKGESSVPDYGMTMALSAQVSKGPIAPFGHGRTPTTFCRGSMWRLLRGQHYRLGSSGSSMVSSPPSGSTT